MAHIKLLPPTAHLQACFAYNPETGELTWRTRLREHFAHARVWGRCNTMFAGKTAGTIAPSGYWVVLLGQVPYLCHRIDWKLMTGEEPPAVMDHINRDRLDNRWVNLRAATKLQNLGNQRLHRTNTSGYRGVSPHAGGKWIASIGRHYLGLFDTPEAAAAAYQAAALEHYGEFYSLSLGNKRVLTGSVPS